MMRRNQGKSLEKNKNQRLGQSKGKKIRKPREPRGRHSNATGARARLARVAHRECARKWCALGLVECDFDTLAPVAIGSLLVFPYPR